MPDHGRIERDPGSLAAPLFLTLVAGLALPVWRGGWLPLLAIVVAVVTGELLRRRMSAQVSARAWPDRLREAPVTVRLAVALLVMLPAAVLVAVAARGIASLVVAHPGSLWGVLLAAFGGALLIIPRTARVRWPLALAFAVGIPVAGVAGARFEAAGPDARGWVFSGPLLGIHPFQSTAVLVDGYGPHDLPINDFVEPDGARGYGPDELADALEHALHRIADLHYADGPARAYQAFAEARVTATTTHAVRERLDREPVEPLQFRLLVESGTAGRGSSVEFRCPGIRDDARGPAKDNVIKRMCPTKYVSEASAGLGMTGRWAGYTEKRGGERVGISRVLARVRTDDAAGRKGIEQEVRWGAWIVLVMCVGFFVSRRTGRDTREGALAVTGATGLLAVVVGAFAVARHGAAPMVGMFETPPAWISISAVDLTPALAPCLVFVAWLLPTSPPAAGGAARIAPVPVALGTLAATGSLGAMGWLVPSLSTTDTSVAFQRFVTELADAATLASVAPAPWGIVEVEAAIGAMTGAILFGGIIAILCVAASLVGAPLRARGAGWQQPVGIVAIVAGAAAVTVSRKTLGGGALVPSAMVTLLVLGSGLGRLGRAQGPSAARFGLHVVLVVGACWFILASTAHLPSHNFVMACRILGIAACLASFTLLVPSRASSGRVGGA